jgi:hypothetical protein
MLRRTALHATLRLLVLQPSQIPPQGGGPLLQLPGLPLAGRHRRPQKPVAGRAPRLQSLVADKLLKPTEQHRDAGISANAYRWSLPDPSSLDTNQCPFSFPNPYERRVHVLSMKILLLNHARNHGPQKVPQIPSNHIEMPEPSRASGHPN